MIIFNRETSHYIISGEINTAPLSQEVNGATMTTDTNNKSVLHIEGWNYTYEQTLELGEFYIFDKTSGNLSLVKGYRDAEIVDNKIDLFLDKPFNSDVSGEDVYIILPTSYRGQGKISLSNIGASNIVVNGVGTIKPSEVHLYESENSFFKPIVVNAENSSVLVTNAEISSIGGGTTSGTNYTLATLEFTDEQVIELEHNLGFPTILSVYVDGDEISVAPSDNGSIATIDFGTPLTGTATYLKTV